MQCFILLMKGCVSVPLCLFYFLCFLHLALADDSPPTPLSALSFMHLFFSWPVIFYPKKNKCIISAPPRITPLHVHTTRCKTTKRKGKLQSQNPMPALASSLCSPNNEMRNNKKKRKASISHKTQHQHWH